MCILRTECAPSFYSWVRVIKGALTPEVKTLAHWPTYEVIYRPTMTRLGPTYNQPIQCNPWWCNPNNNTCLANCPCYCFGRQPMKNLLTNDVMLTTTRVWLKITSPQKRAASYKMTARTQAHSVRYMHISCDITDIRVFWIQLTQWQRF